MMEIVREEAKKAGYAPDALATADDAGVRSVSVVEGSSVMGLSRGDWEKLEEAEKAKARERARAVFVDERTDFVIENLSELPALIRMLSA